jgi:hypothetical protein
MGLALGSIALIAMLTSQPVLAGLYSDELADCLVRSTSDADKSYLVHMALCLSGPASGGRLHRLGVGR